MNIETFFKITYGLYVVSSRFGDKMSGFISNTVFQVTAEPYQFAVVCNKNNFTASLISQSKNIGISILPKDIDAGLFGNFGYKSGKDFNKFEHIEYKFGQTGAPILHNESIAWIECELVQTFDVGTHLIFIGKVIDGEILDDSAEPLTYEYYRNVKKGKAPKNAPTYIDPEKILKQEISKDKIYKCIACGFVYDPETGDPENNIPAGTPFDQLPEQWNCPVCGADKSFFNEV